LILNICLKKTISNGFKTISKRFQNGFKTVSASVLNYNPYTIFLSILYFVIKTELETAECTLRAENHFNP
jgi:hypothetical protein